MRRFPRLIDAFVDAFNARDVGRLVALLVEDATLQVVGATEEWGDEVLHDGPLQGMLFGSRKMHDPSARERFDLEAQELVLPEPPRAEVRHFRGEALVVLWYRHTDGEFVRAFVRLEVEGDRARRVENHFFTPEVLRDVCAELGLPCRVNGYRYCAR